MNLPALPDFSHITKDEATHTYTTHEGQVLRNVTALIQSLQIPFDAPYHAGRKAAERGTTAAVILAEWEQNRTTAKARGTWFHTHIQHRLTDQPIADETLLPEMIAFDHWWEDTRAGTAGLSPIRSEWVIGDVALGIAGTLDALLVDAHGHLVLYDWKTGKRFNTYNRFDSLRAPFSDLPDCELYRYSMQLSLYRLILRRAGVSPVTGTYILHFGPNGGYQRYTALDFTDRLEAWLTRQPATLLA
jgi:ATP-dependent exoDNAse (exonuclease V) beta subunit